MSVQIDNDATDANTKTSFLIKDAQEDLHNNRLKQ